MSERIAIRLRPNPLVPVSRDMRLMGLITKLNKYDNIDDLLVQLAKVCIDFNLYRKDDEYYDFSFHEVSYLKV